MLVSSFAAFLLNLVIFIFLVFLKGPFCLASSYYYEECAPRNYGDVMNVSFPFYVSGGFQTSFCGYPGFRLDCNNGSLTIQISGNNYLVTSIDNYSGSMRLRNSPVTTCPLAITHLTLDYNVNTFSLYTPSRLVILKNCSISQLPAMNLTRYRIGSCDQLVMSYSDTNIPIGRDVCTEMVAVPIEWGYNNQSFPVVDGGNYTEVMKMGFELNWRAPSRDT